MLFSGDILSDWSVVFNRKIQLPLKCFEISTRWWWCFSQVSVASFEVHWVKLQMFISLYSVNQKLLNWFIFDRKWAFLYIWYLYDICIMLVGGIVNLFIFNAVVMIILVLLLNYGVMFVPNNIKYLENLFIAKVLPYSSLMLKVILHVIIYFLQKLVISSKNHVTGMAYFSAHNVTSDSCPTFRLIHNGVHVILHCKYYQWQDLLNYCLLGPWTCTHVHPLTQHLC